jgi:hypothetical protein
MIRVAPDLATAIKMAGEIEPPPASVRGARSD